MLIYSNRQTARIIFQIAGSVVFRASTVYSGIPIILLTLSLQLQKEYADEAFFLPMLPDYGIQTAGSALAFAVIFRVNLAWGRYWEAVTNIRYMYNKWQDAFSQFDTFVVISIKDAKAKGDTASAARVGRLKEARETMESYFYLLSALANDRLHKGDCETMVQSRRLGVPWSQCILQSEDLNSDDFVIARALPRFQEAEGVARQSSDMSWRKTWIIPRMPKGARLTLLTEAEDRVTLVMHWIFTAMAQSQSDLSTAPPIQSRMYQELSNGQTGFSNVLNISDIPFPFAYAQLLTLLLCLWTVLLPAYVAREVESVHAGPILAFLLFTCIWCLNELGRELENPLGSGVNDIRLAGFHVRFVGCIESIRRSGDLEISAVDAQELTSSSEGVEECPAEAVQKCGDSGSPGPSQASSQDLCQSIGRHDPADQVRASQVHSSGAVTKTQSLTSNRATFSPSSDDSGRLADDFNSDEVKL